jgi:hypothetical protein
MSTKLKPRTLHFDLSGFSQEREYTLLAGSAGKFVLKRYADHTSKLDEHRARNHALGLIAENRVSRLTHFIEDAPLHAEKANFRRVVFPSLDDHPLPEIAMVFPHIPDTHLAACHNRFYRGGRKLPHSYVLGAYGVQAHEVDEALGRLTGVSREALRLQTLAIQPPGRTAQSIVLHHPEIGSVNPGVQAFILDEYLNPLHSQDMSDLVKYIQDHPPSSDPDTYGWYNKSWVMWAKEDQTGPTQPGRVPEMVPAEVDMTIKYKGGATITDWPTPPNADYPGMGSYNLTDEYDPPAGNPDNPSLIEASGPVVKSTLIATKNDPDLNGLLWNKQNGVTNVPPTAPTVTDSRSEGSMRRTATSVGATFAGAAAEGSAAQGFTVKNQTSSYGLELYDLTFDTGTKNVTLPVKNWPSRYLGAYVEFQKEDGTPIKRSDIKGWTDNVPDFVSWFVQSSDTKNYLTWLSAGNAIFGVPVPPLTQKTDLKFLWPDEASRGLVLLGGLGVAEGFRDWDTAVDIVGVLGTGFVNFGIGTLTLVADVYIVNPFLDGLKGDKAVAFYAVMGVIGASALVVGSFEADTSWGKMILSKLADTAASAIFGAIGKRAVTAIAKEYVKQFSFLSALTTSEITAEEALEAVPVAGWALRVVSVASDIAALAATTVECLLSPATYSLEILRTMDLTVTVRPDPTHGKTGFKPIWPAVADHYVIQVKYPSGNNQDGGTTYTLAGPMPGQHDEDIVVTFPGIPAGGKIEIVAQIYSAANWLAGAWNGGWINAVPDANDKLAASGAIVEFLVPLTPATTYSQKQAIAYSVDKKHYWAVSAFSIDAILVPDLDKGGTPSAAIRKAFDDNGDPLSATAVITVDTSLQRWTITDKTAGTTFDVNARQIAVAPVFTLDAASYKSELNAGGPVPAHLADAFAKNQYPLPDSARITVVSRDVTWTIAGPGQLPAYALNADGANIDVQQTSYELSVQNTAQAAPPLPESFPLSTSPGGHALGALQNIIINDNEFMLGYAYLASGQNMPFFGTTETSEAPMYAMQAISTLGQPQDQIIQPTYGFSQQTFLAFDQFGLTPLFIMEAALAGELKNGPVPPDVAKEFADFGYTLPADGQVTVVTSDKVWTIGESGQTPLYQIQYRTEQVDGKPQQQLGAYAYPVPGLDNYFMEPQPKVGDTLKFYLRGVDLNKPPGEYTFNYSTPADPNIWGIFQNDSSFQDLVVHPNGFALALDVNNGKLFTLKLPGAALPPDQAPLAMPLSGLGSRQGLLDGPQAMTVTADGRVLILETGTTYLEAPRIQAFDVKGNPVPSFSVGQPSFQITTDAVAIIQQLDGRDVSLELLQLFQQNITPAVSPKAVTDSSLDSIADSLDQSRVDDTLVAVLQQYGLAGQDAATTQFTVTVTKAGSLWFVTDTTSQAVYDVRLVMDSVTGFQILDVYLQFGLSIVIQSKGVKWQINDTVNSMSFTVDKSPTESKLTVQEVVSVMPLRAQNFQGTLTYLDIATETKGFIYVLSVIDNNYNSTHNPADLVFQLDIYNPDGTPLLEKPQTGINAGRITVDQYRSLFALNYNAIVGPNSRTEPGVSQWIPSTLTPAT